MNVLAYVNTIMKAINEAEHVRQNIGDVSARPAETIN